MRCSSGAHGNRGCGCGCRLKEPPATRGKQHPETRTPTTAAEGFAPDFGKFRGEVTHKYKPVRNTRVKRHFSSSWTVRWSQHRAVGVHYCKQLPPLFLQSTSSLQTLPSTDSLFPEAHLLSLYFRLLSVFVAATSFFAVKWPLPHCWAMLNFSEYLAGPSAVSDRQWPGKAPGPDIKLITSKRGPWHANQQSLHNQLHHNCNCNLAFHPLFTVITQTPLISPQYLTVNHCFCLVSSTEERSVFSSSHRSAQTCAL